MTATLTSNGKPLAEKLITFATPAGSISLISGKTDSNGQVAR